MSQPLKIDFVSDVVCPWCAIGLSALEQALAKLPEIQAELRFMPFELNPQMGPDGEEIVPYLAGKYGISAEQVAASQQQIQQRGAELGFRFDMDKRTHTYNTFDAHRLLHWAGLEGKQLALKKALLAAHFTDGQNPGDHLLLVSLAEAAGLDGDQARQVLESGAFAEEVRAEEAFYQQRGISSVPAVILNGKYLISGGQPVEYFEQALRQVAAENA
ncbi:DsbA family oxidoreductase [Gallaecimonas kandeliae]|uniref:DsbA family oxidoreductase n=1 Tax=Gallaecimonas kandeliae TaxID=3029055 RepID=UPI002649227A|nr:DsbA family oxidoreductase [Gallaecimonas kandeliae]WKE65343.1 DsbA family oxidoreductase [Gallaecimonas kandeliae]